MFCSHPFIYSSGHHLFAVVVTSAFLVLASGACTDSNPDRQVRCETVDVEGTTYCVYGQPITETGYDCPAAMPHSTDMHGGTVCASNRNVPGKHEERLRDEVQRQRGAETEPDNGVVSDTKPDRVDGGEPRTRPNACGENAFVHEFLGGVQAFDFPTLPWKIVSAGGTSTPASFDGTWRGLETLDATVSFDCPPGADALGLNCSTDRAMVIERTEQGTTLEVKIAVSLPLDQATFPPDGTSVRVDYRTSGMRANEGRGLSLVNNETDEYTLVIEEVVADRNDNPTFHLSETYGPIGVSIDVQRSDDRTTDPSTAYCIATDACRRTWRFEFLEVAGMTSQKVAPGEVTTISTGARTYQFSHLLAATHLNVRGWGLGCADAVPAKSSFGFVTSQ